MDIQTLMARVVALRELAARATTPAEREVALTQAAGIVAKYQIDEASLPTSDQARTPEAVEECEPLFVVSGRLSSWRSVLARGLADLHGCAVLCNRTQTIRAQAQTVTVTVRVAGRRSDVEVVRYFWAWLTYEVERLADREHGAAKHKFRMGAAVGAVRAMRAASQATRAAAGERGRASRSYWLGAPSRGSRYWSVTARLGAARYTSTSGTTRSAVGSPRERSCRRGLAWGRGTGGQAPRLGAGGK